MNAGDGLHSSRSREVEKAYRNTAFKDDAQRIEFLFQRYQTLVDAEKKFK